MQDSNMHGHTCEAKCSDEFLNRLQGIDCSATGRVANLTVAVNVPQRGGNLTVNPKFKHPGASLGNLSGLLNLFIANVNFSAPIPPELGNLHNLLTLQLYGNSFTGALPSTLGQLTKLTALIIDGASFTPGVMPSSFCNMVSLITLDIVGDLTSLPPCLSTSLKKLQELRLGNNKLTGPIPVRLTYFPELTSIDLHGNQFIGADFSQRPIQLLILSTCPSKFYLSSRVHFIYNYISFSKFPTIDHQTQHLIAL